MNRSVYTYNYVVQQSDLDVLNHVNNIVYLKWVQEASIKHWVSLTQSIGTDKYVWVVVRHEIDYLRQLFLDDNLEIKTWVSDTEGSFSVRYVEFYRKRKLVCKAKTNWRFLDAKTFRPTDIPDNIIRLLQN